MSKRALGLLLLLLVARLVPVLSIADVFAYGEEASKGTGAMALLDGTGLPRWQLNYVYHEGGAFLVMHLKALLYWLVGPSVLANKLTALVTTSLLFVVGLWLVGEHFGRRAATIFGLLFVLCPDAYVRFSLLSIGTHFEALILIALVLHFAMRVLFDPRAPLSDWMLLGMSSGLGIYASLQTAPALAAVALAVLLVLRRRAFGIGTWTALLGFGLGAMPLWAMMGRVGLAALFVQDHSNFAGGLTGLEALRALFHDLVDEPDLWAWVQTLGYGFLAGFGLRLAARGEDRVLRGRIRLILAFLALFLVLYAGSGFALPHQGHWIFWLRCSSLWFFATVLAAVGAAALLDRSRQSWREAALGVLALLLTGGISALAGLAAEGRPTALVENWEILAGTKGYDPTTYFDKKVHHLEGSLPERFETLLRFPGDPERMLPAATHAVFEKSGLPLADALAITKEVCGERWRTAALGLGLVAAPRYGNDLPAAFRAIETQPEDARPVLAEAVGRVALGIKIVPEKIEAQARADVPSPYRGRFLRGAGWRLHRLYPLRPDLALALAGRLPVEAIPDVLSGYESARRASELE